MAKKVVIILVEGATEEICLYERLREVYSGCQIKFEIQNGDIFLITKKVKLLNQ